jgi:hypothetical protein
VSRCPPDRGRHKATFGKDCPQRGAGRSPTKLRSASAEALANRAESNRPSPLLALKIAICGDEVNTPAGVGRARCPLDFGDREGTGCVLGMARRSESDHGARWVSCVGIGSSHESWRPM